jgi:hypothetical protein
MHMGWDDRDGEIFLLTYYCAFVFEQEHIEPKYDDLCCFLLTKLRASISQNTHRLSKLRLKAHVYKTSLPLLQIYISINLHTQHSLKLLIVFQIAIHKGHFPLLICLSLHTNSSLIYIHNSPLP